MFPHPRSALLIVDPLNDFIAEGGKLWPYAREIAEHVKLVDNLRLLAAHARKTGTLVVYVPHHRHVGGDYADWKYPCPTHVLAAKLLPFERGSWGAEFHAQLSPEPGDVIAQDHWLQDGFMNTDLELSLRVRGVERLFVTGMRTNTCVEATARRAVELGHHVTLVRDATAAFRWEEWTATLDVNAPTFAHAVRTTEEVLDVMTDAAARLAGRVA
jgi:nicotinamidase-related amidase